jgi:DNA-binding LacI/PurR family transcriptional regulator
MEKVNITRVAREAGVSKTTISNYLNKKPGKISDDTRRRIVGSDYVQAVKEAAEHFFSHNVYNIVVSAGHTNTIVGRQIMEGYSLAFKKRGLTFPAGNIITQKETASESIYDECLELLKQDDRPGAFILSEYHYHDLVKAAAELNLKLYGDIKVIIMNYFLPMPDSRITRFNVRCYEVGKTAAEKLIDLMDGKETEPCLFSMTCVQGNSCGCGET